MSKQETRGERVCRFIETFLLVPEGEFVGQPLKLADFQRKFILDVYDNPHGCASKPCVSVAAYFERLGRLIWRAFLCYAFAVNFAIMSVLHHVIPNSGDRRGKDRPKALRWSSTALS